MWTVSAALWGEGEGELDAAALLERLALPARFPLPWPSGFVRARLAVEGATDGRAALRLEVRYAPREPVRFFGLEVGRELCLELRTAAMPSAELAAAQAAWEALAGSGPRLEGALCLTGTVRLPPLPGDVPLSLGDEEGWIAFSVAGEAAAGIGDAATVDLKVELAPLGTVALQLPLLPQPEPPIVASVDAVRGQFAYGGADAAATLTLAGEGRFRFAPPSTGGTLPETEHVRRLLAAIPAVRGSVALALHLSAGAPELTLRGTLDGAEVRLDLLAALQRLVRGTWSEDDHGAVGFGLRELNVRLGREPAVALDAAATLGDVTLPAHVELSARELRLGVGASSLSGSAPAVELPLRVPHVTAASLGFPDGVRGDAPGRPDAWIRARVSPDRHDAYDAGVRTLLESIETLTGVGSGASGSIVARRPEDEQRPGGWEVRRRDGVPPDDEAPPFRLASGTVELVGTNGIVCRTRDLAVACQVDGDWHVVLAAPALAFDGFHLALGFSGARDLRIGGTVSFVFHGPDAGQARITARVELAPDTIYFSVDGTSAPALTFGDFQLHVARLLVGFGYTKQSLAGAFAGELHLPREVVALLDTSDAVGAGVRLPERSKVDLKLDVIPVSLGAAVIPVPLLQFGLDLRAGSGPGLRDVATCEPRWDGLQVIVPNVARISLERAAFSLFLTLFQNSNATFAGSLALGDAANGLTVVADDVFWAFGVLDSGMALLISPITALPFCNNGCVSLRLGGFQLHFNVQRPVPQLSPLALFELLALVADPSGYAVAPEGELANTIRVALQDAYVTVPEALRRLLPAAPPVLRKPFDVTINLATFITLIQRTARHLRPVADALADAWRSREATGARLRAAAIELQTAGIEGLLRDLLAALPPELRKVRVEASFAGFEGKALLLLADRRAVTRAMHAPRRRRPPPERTLPPEAAWDAEAMQRFQPAVGAAHGGAHAFDPFAEHPLDGSELAGFGPADLDALMVPVSGALLAAGDVRPPLRRALRDGTTVLARHLRTGLSPKVLEALARHGDGPLPAAVERRLLAELNALLKGDGGDASLHTAERFAGVTLERPVRTLLERHARTPMRGPELARLNRLLLEAAFPDGVRTPVGILVAARLRLLARQRVRFVGFVYEDGAFGMVSALDPAPLRLTVAGLAAELPLAVRGRLTLEGRARRDGVSGSVRAQVHTAAGVRWPAIGTLVSVALGSEKEPAELTLHADGRFRVQGTGTVRLFDDAVRLDGWLDVSERHCLVDGHLRFAAGDDLRLKLCARGRIGPGEAFELAGTGTLTVLGVPLPLVDARVDPRGAEVAVRVTELRCSDAGGALGVECELDAALRGWIDLRASLPPRFALGGEGAIRVPRWGVDVRGSAELGSGETGPWVRVGGALTVHGRPWADGWVRLERGTVRLGGRLSVGVGAQGGMQFVALALEGELAFDALGLASWRFSRLAAQLAFGGDAGRPLVLEAPGPIVGGRALDLDLATLAGFRLQPPGELPLPSIPLPAIPLPAIEPVPGAARVTFELTSEGLPSPAPLPPQWAYIFTVRAPDGSVTIPVGTGTERLQGRVDLATAYQLTGSATSPGTLPVPPAPLDWLGPALPAVRLVWAEDRLALILPGEVRVDLGLPPRIDTPP